MTYQRRFDRGSPGRITATPGEIWHFKTGRADHPKYHLCVSFDGHFLWLNSPKDRKPRRGDFVLPEEAVRRLPRNARAISFVRCTLIIEQPPNVILTPLDARGALLPEEMLDIIDYIERNGTIPVRESDPWLPDLRVWATTFQGIRR